MSAEVLNCGKDRAGSVPTRLPNRFFGSRHAAQREPNRESAVNMLKYIYLTLLHLGKQVWLIPHTVAQANRQRRRQVLLNELEAERLDRIRNPSKYLGK